MLEKVISISLNNKALVLLAVAAMAIWGVYSLTEISIDAVPDITNNQVQVVTSCPTLAPQEVEQYITFPIEALMANLPKVEEVRSISRYGLSVVTVVFADNMDGMLARQLVAEQVQRARSEIPSDLGAPEMMPITTGLGEIYQYVLVVDSAHQHLYNPMELRTIQDWIVKRQLSGVPGVIETSSFGGFVKQYEVAINPEKLNANGLTIEQVFEALKNNNLSSGGGYIESGAHSFYLRSEGKITELNELANITVDIKNGVPIRLTDVATFKFGHPQRYGAMTMDGEGEVVGGITLMLKGANATSTTQLVKQRIETIRKSLPPGVDVYPYLDRAKLVNKTIGTVAKNLIEGGLIIIFVLVLFIGNLRAGIVVASVIPLSMLFTIIVMNQMGVSANLMSLGAIDFGIVIDGAVIMVEGILFYLHHHFMNKTLSKDQMNEAVHQASKRIYNSSTFGVLIIVIVFLPMFMLKGVEGKMFIPMAQTMSFAIVGALILSLTYVPAMSALVLSKKVKPDNKVTAATLSFLQRLYRPALNFALSTPRLIIVLAISAFLITAFAFSRMGSEFIPTLEEGDLAMQMSVAPGSSLSHSIATSSMAEKILKRDFPEVLHVVSKIGTAEIPTDPMAVEDADIMIILKEKEEWTSASDRESLIEKMKASLAVIQDASFEFTQPIQLRFNELMTGAKTDISVKIFGENMEVLKDLADEAAVHIAKIEGAADVKVEQTEGLRQLRLKINRQQMALFGVNVQEVNHTIESAYGGSVAGLVYENERRFELVLRMDEQWRQNLNLHSLFVRGANNQLVPLSAVATITEDTGPMQISREDAKRRINIGINTRQRDVATIVADIDQVVHEKIKLPPGYFITYGGQFENLQHATERLKMVVPIALGLILLLLFLALKSMKDSFIILAAIPLATVGGIWALIIRGMPFSISAGIGFIALFGVAVLNGLVLINEFKRLKKENNMDMSSLIRNGAASRLRPVLMTALTGLLGFLPMALSTGLGAEVQKPLATVVIGGLITSTLLTLLVLPAIYLLVNKSKFNKIKPAIVLLLLVGLVPASFAQQSYTRDQVVASALKNRVNITQAQLNIEEWEIRKRDNYRLAPLEFNLQYGQINFPGSDYNMQIMQDLGNPFSAGKSAKWSKTGLEHAKQQLILTEKQVKFEIEQAYEYWLFTGALVQQYKSYFEQFNRLDSIAANQARAGLIGPIEEQMALQLAMFFRKSNLTWQVEHKNAGHQLVYLAGLEPEAIINTDQFKPMELALSAHSDPLLFKPLELLVQQQGFETQLIKSQKLPRFGAGAFNQSLDGLRSFSGFQVGIILPIISGGVNKDITYSQLRYEQLNSEKLDLQNNLNTEINKTRYELLQLQSILNQYPADFLQTSQSNMNRNIDLLKSGLTEYHDFSLLSKGLLESEIEYLQLLLQHNNAVLKLQYLTQN
jgi:cobalt-zinc-cadmium resistance protein CzcA